MAGYDTANDKLTMISIKHVIAIILGFGYIGTAIFCVMSKHFAALVPVMIGGLICIGVYGVLNYQPPRLPSGRARAKPSDDLFPAPMLIDITTRQPIAAAPAPRKPGVYFGKRVHVGKDGKTVTGEDIDFTGDEHVLLIGPTRSGKGRCVLAPNLILDDERSALVIDPKGELARWTADYRESKGHEVIYLDPFGVLEREPKAKERTKGFNPLRNLDPASPRFVDDVMTIAEALIIPGEKEPHWGESAQDLVAGIIMQEVIDGKDGANFGSIRETLSSDIRELGTFCEVCCERKKDQIIANKLSRFISLGNLDHEPSRELTSIISTASTQTRFLDSPLVAASLADGSIDFAAMKQRNITIYLVLPPDMLKTHAKWLRLVVAAAIRDLQKTFRNPKRPDVMLMLDEFPALGRMEIIKTSVSLNAGYGIKIFAVTQDLTLLKEHYSESWETFLSGGAVASLAPRDAFTSEYLSRLSGQELEHVRNMSAGRDGYSQSVAAQFQPTLLPHELRQMPRGMMVVFAPTKDGQRIWRCSVPDFSELPAIAQHIRNG